MLDAQTSMVENKDSSGALITPCKFAFPYFLISHFLKKEMKYAEQWWIAKVYKMILFEYLGSFIQNAKRERAKI